MRMSMPRDAPGNSILLVDHNDTFYHCLLVAGQKPAGCVSYNDSSTN